MDFKKKTANGSDFAVFAGTFQSIDSLAFVSSGGTNAGFGNDGEHFATDDWLLLFEPPQAQPSGSGGG
ncbi:MAG: hypothetical protein ACK486_11070 [Cyanobacteriota bacterium]